jgi:hypothetical protein
MGFANIRPRRYFRGETAGVGFEKGVRWAYYLISMPAGHCFLKKTVVRLKNIKTFFLSHHYIRFFVNTIFF